MSKFNWGMRACGVLLVCATAAVALPAQTMVIAPREPAFTTLYSFCTKTNCTDGVDPFAGLVQGTDGNFYGTTKYGGTPSGTCTQRFGCGMVFKITPGGVLTKLHSFDGTDGSRPTAGLVQGTDGRFYGTTQNGGTPSSTCAQRFGCGTVFRITPAGKLKTLYSFDETDGAAPVAGLLRGTDGNFYGTTQLGGTGHCADGCGTVFKVTPRGVLTTLHSFEGTDGAAPHGVLVQDTNGNLYGTAYNGGANNGGTVFSLSVGLGPFVETQPTSGEVGAAVTILGTNLTGSTSVTFNGTAATFTVVSASEITTTVPTGATTGTVQVVTPGGTLSSNVPFRVK
jgi:uncharacterized repeat protein (TIGR03803 family)